VKNGENNGRNMAGVAKEMAYKALENIGEKRRNNIIKKKSWKASGSEENEKISAAAAAA
jgi:hypothetical protein